MTLAVDRPRPDAPDDLARRAAETIQRGSKSFAAAAKLFDPPTRESAVMLYAWCRHCDDVVDGQDHGHRPDGGRCADTGEADRADALARLEVLEAQTAAVFAGSPTGEPAFAALAEVVRRHAVSRDLALEHLAGFRMDVEGRRFATIDDTLGYCWHVAGVVGVMMARVMGASDPATLDRACDLGLAFQLTNIARDVVDDAEVARVYLPLDWLAEAGIPESELAALPHRPALARLTARLVDRAEPYYASARIGLADLPLRSAWAVATALCVYRAIGIEVKRRGPEAWDSRVSTSKVQKLGFVVGGLGLALRSRTMRRPPRSSTLWTRPRRQETAADQCTGSRSSTAP
ncbi:phytoene/squalene synthase family protein [Mangrovibrevibacter kandeliae]|uniref:phytoene/squalene synthase family protein n=1 Tax=Mangrovibrevibacter kandeliae TaxID=2968473 RepID=UPI0021174731|nr:phytoene/squalene synthase family protein [Aurantimonas sp. CSK15Z-1]